MLSFLQVGDGGCFRDFEQQVLGQRRIGVITLHIEKLDEARFVRPAAGFENPVPEAATRLQKGCGKIGILGRIDMASKAEAIDIVFKADGAEGIQPARDQVRVALQRRRIAAIEQIVPEAAGKDIAVRPNIADLT